MHPTETTAVTPLVELLGRSSSHFTRVAAIFAHELRVPFELVVVHDMKRTDAATYGENPARKLPTLRVDGALVFGTENICRKLAELARRSDATPCRVVWPEELAFDVSRNAQELVWHCMSAQVQLIIGTVLGKLPPDNLFFTKSKAGFEGSLEWLEAHLAQVLEKLPPDRDLSMFEVTLHCLLEHIAFRPVVSLDAHPALQRFVESYGARPSSRRTVYRFDPPGA